MCSGPDSDPSFPHIWLVPVQSRGLQQDCSWLGFDEYHIFLCITHRLSIKTVIRQQCGLQAYVSYVRGSLLWGPLFPSSPIASNSPPICFLYAQVPLLQIPPYFGFCPALFTSDSVWFVRSHLGMHFQMSMLFRENSIYVKEQVNWFFSLFFLYFFFLFLFALWKIEGKEIKEKFQFSDWNWIWKNPHALREMFHLLESYYYFKLLKCKFDFVLKISFRNKKMKLFVSRTLNQKIRTFSFRAPNKLFRV